MAGLDVQSSLGAAGLEKLLGQIRQKEPGSLDDCMEQNQWEHSPWRLT